MRFALFAFALLPGCYLSHYESGGDGGITGSDDGALAVCAPVGGAVTVEVQPLEPDDPASCRTLMHRDHVRPEWVMPEPSVGGIRVRIDVCADDSGFTRHCYCDWVLGGVGTDIDDSMRVSVAGTGMPLDWTPRSFLLDGNVGLRAVDGDPAAVFSMDARMQLVAGTPLCATDECAPTITTSRVVTAWGTHEWARGRDAPTHDLPHLRVIRDLRTSCDPTTCSTCVAPTADGAWLAWGRFGLD